MNRLTVVVPIKSFEQINPTIDSLLRQSYVNIRVIVVVDMNNLQAISIVRNYASKVICYLTTREEDWEAAAKRILQECDSHYVSLVHSGTILAPEWAKACIDLLKKDSFADGVFANAVKLTGDGRVDTELNAFQSLTDVIFINSYMNKYRTYLPLITYVSNYSYLLSRSGYLPSSARITDTILAGVRTVPTLTSNVTTPSLHNFIKLISHTTIAANYDSLRGSTYQTTYLNIYTMFIKQLLLKGRFISAMKLSGMFLYRPGNRKNFLKLLIKGQ